MLRRADEKVAVAVVTFPGAVGELTLADPNIVGARDLGLE